jgi:UDP-N-acetylglucosamine 1-carboxyvinyltransferase
MTTLNVRGGIGRITMKVAVPGAKNSAMPIVAAAAIAPGTVDVVEVPDITDLHNLTAILRTLGIPVEAAPGRLAIGLPDRNRLDRKIPAELSSRLRGSIYTLGVLAALTGEGTIGAIGGDSLSDDGRRADLLPHGRMFAGFGLELTRCGSGWMLTGGPPRPGEFAIQDNGITASAMAAMIAASLPGRSVIREASPEIEVDDTLEMLSRLGAGADRDGSALVVTGPLTGCEEPLTIPQDRIYAGTLAIAAAATGGSAQLDRRLSDRMTAVLASLSSFGVRVTATDSGTLIEGAPTRGARVGSGLYPAVSSDLLPLFAVLAAQAPGESMIEESVYHGRDGHVTGLTAMGADIERAGGNRLLVRGPTAWRSTEVDGAGIRETCALYLAALLAPGVSAIRNASALGRGYAGLQDMIEASRLESA